MIRTAARVAFVAAAVLALFAVPAIVSRLDVASAPCGTPVTPSPYGYPPAGVGR